MKYAMLLVAVALFACRCESSLIRDKLYGLFGSSRPQQQQQTEVAPYPPARPAQPEPAPYPPAGAAPYPQDRPTHPAAVKGVLSFGFNNFPALYTEAVTPATTTTTTTTTTVRTTARTTPRTTPRTTTTTTTKAPQRAFVSAIVYTDDGVYQDNFDIDKEYARNKQLGRPVQPIIHRVPVVPTTKKSKFSFDDDDEEVVATTKDPGRATIEGTPRCGPGEGFIAGGCRPAD